MLLLLFEIGDGRYALDAGVVVEVIPRIHCKQIPLSAHFVAGIINYRGNPVPVIDLCSFHNSVPCANRLSTRIIIVNHIRKNFKNVHVGLIAERVTETAFVDDKYVHKSRVLIGLNLGKEDQEESSSMVQWYDLDHLLTENLLDDILQN